jgi:hypothetical protein
VSRMLGFGLAMEALNWVGQRRRGLVAERDNEAVGAPLELRAVNDQRTGLKGAGS